MASYLPPLSLAYLSANSSRCAILFILYVNTVSAANKFIKWLPNSSILKPLDKPKDYLAEERNKKSKENNNQPTYKSYVNENKWENILNSNNNVYNNIEQIKMEAQILQNKADSKKELLKNDAVDVKVIDDVNNEISNLYIGSIKAKLQILKKIGN